MIKKITAILLTLVIVSEIASIETFSQENDVGLPTSVYDSGSECNVSRDLADSVVSQLFSQVPEGQETNGGYEYCLEGEAYDSLVSSLEKGLEEADGEQSLSFPQTMVEAETVSLEEGNDSITSPAEDRESSNQLPENYVDNSNEGLDEILANIDDYAQVPTSQSRAAEAPKADVVFIIDNTGSMGEAIEAVKNNVAQFASSLYSKGLNLRLGLINYQDITYDGIESTVIHKENHSPWFTSYVSFLTALRTVYADDGGDTPETPLDALGYLTDDRTMLWSTDAYKFAILITDAPYKIDNRHGITDLSDMVGRLSSREIYTSVITGYENYETYGDLATQTSGILANLYDNFADILDKYAESVYSTSTTAAENYSIKVTDAATGLPIQGANISFRGGGGSTKSNGIAVIASRTNPVTDLIISKVGYQTYQADNVTLERDRTISFSLEGTQDAGQDGTPLFQSSMLINPMSSNEKISAPTVSIFGKEFSLLNLPTSMELKLFDKGNVVIEHDKDKKMFSAIIGADVAKIEEGGYWEDYRLYKNIVQTFSSKSPKQIRTDFMRLKGQLKKSAKLLFPLTTNVAGYIDVSYSSGNLEFAEGGVVIAAQMDTPFGVSYPIPPAPYIFIKVEVKVDAELKLAFVKVVDSGKVAFSPTADLSLTPSVSGTMNLGVDKVAYVGGGIKGELESKLKIPSKLSETLTVTLKGSWVWEIKLGPLEYSGEQSWGNGVQLFPLNARYGSRSLSLADVSTDDFSLIPRPLKKKSARTVVLPEFIRYDANVYESGAPQLVELDNGNLLLVWLGDDSDRSLANASALYYSIYDGNYWSAATLVDEDKTADFNPFLYKADDGRVHLVWQDCNTSFSESDITLEDFAKSTDISYISFSETGEISTKKKITETDALNGAYKTGAQVSARGDSVSVVWLENSENDLLLADGQNSIQRVRIENGIVQEKETLAEFVGNVTNFASDYIADNQNIIAYTTGDYDSWNGVFVDNPVIILGGDVSYSISTYDGGDWVYDEEIDDWVYVEGMPPSINSLQFSQGNLYWSDDEGIKMVSDLQWSGSDVSDVTKFAASNFKILENGDKNVIVMQSEGITNEIYVSYNNVGEWSNPTLLTSYEKRLSMPTGVLRSDGKICLTFNQTTLNSDDGSFNDAVTDLVVAEYEQSGPDLEIDPQACIPIGEIAPNAETYISVFAKNNGASSTSDIRAKVTLDSEVPYETEVYAMPEYGSAMEDISNVYSIEAGEEMELLIPIKLPTILGASHTVNVEIIDGTGETEDRVGSNKTASCSFFAAPDLEVSDVNVVRSVSGAEITATVKNVGVAQAENIIVSLFDENEFSNEHSIETKNIGKLAEAEQRVVEFTVDKSFLNAESEYDYKRFIVHVMTDKEEGSLVNNSDSALLPPILVSGMELEKNEITVQAGQKAKIGYKISPSNASNKNVIWHSSNLNVARVDEEGVITGFRDGEAVITAISAANGDISQSATVHVVGMGSSPSGIHINREISSIRKGETVLLEAAITPADSLNQEVIWYSDNPEIATIEAEGLQAKVTGVAEGKVNISVVTVDGGYTDQMELHVIEDVPLISICLNKDTLLMKKGQTETLVTSYNPADTTDDKTIIWSTSNPGVAKVANGTVTAQNAGTAMIIAKVGSKEAKCKVTVQMDRHTVTFNSNGGKIGTSKKGSSIKKVTVIDGNRVIVPATRTMCRKGYIFAGWFTSKKGGIKVTGKWTPAITENVVYYAHWNKVKKPGQVKKLRLDNPKSGQLRVRFRKVSAVQGYQITYAINSRFTKGKKTVNIGKGSSTSKIIKKMKKGTTYWVKVQAYRVDSAGKKKYGKNSLVKKIILIK